MLYVAEKLSQLDKRDRSITEKRISDVLLEIDMSLDKDTLTNSQLVIELIIFRLCHMEIWTNLHGDVKQAFVERYFISHLSYKLGLK